KRAFQDFVGYYQLLIETELSGDGTSVLLDKSLIDALAYWEVLIGGETPVWGCQLASRRYTLCFVTDPTDIDDSTADPLQASHWPLRPALDRSITRWSAQLSSRTVRLSGTVTARLTVAHQEVHRAMQTLGSASQ